MEFIFDDFIDLEDFASSNRGPDIVWELSTEWTDFNKSREGLGMEVEVEVRVNGDRRVEYGENSEVGATETEQNGCARTSAIVKRDSA